MVSVCLCPAHRNQVQEMHAVDMQAQWKYTDYSAFFKWAEGGAQHGSEVATWFYPGVPPAKYPLVK